MKPRVFFCPQIVLPLGDGSYRVAAGKPVERLTMDQACQMTGLQPRDLREAVEEGDLHAYRPRPRRWWFFAAELTAYLEFTKNHPDFWRNVRTRLAWRAQNLFNTPGAAAPENPSAPPAQGDFFQ
jgi:excisionase family DNA binding protein